jgi:hypothetical protein
LQAKRSDAQDAQRQGLAARSCELVVGRRLHNLAAVAVGNDQASFRGKQLAREVRSHSKEEAVAELTVFGPLLVGAKVGRARFDLNDPDFAGSRDPSQIGASAVCQRKFGNDRDTMRPQKPSDAAADLDGGLRSARLTGCLNLRGQGLLFAVSLGK